MFFRYHAQPAKLLRLFRQFRNQARRIKDYRSAHGRWLLAGVLAYGLATAKLAFSPPAEGYIGLYLLLVLGGGVFLLIGWGLAANLGRYPRRRHSPGGRGGSVFGLIVAGILASLFLSNLRDEALAALPSNPAHPSQVWVVWAWAGLGVFLLSRWIVWRRLKQVRVEEFELDYLDRVLRPLLRDLPPEASCSLGCNPFPSAWTMDFDERKRGAYIFHTYNDALLEFKAKLDGGAVLSLRTLHRRIDKFKQARKKLKDKGSKHRVVQSYRLEHPALARMGAADGERFRGLAARWEGQAGGYGSVLRRDPGRLVVVQKKKFAAPRDLAAGDLPGPELVLGTVRELSGFGAEVAGKGL